MRDIENYEIRVNGEVVGLGDSRIAGYARRPSWLELSLTVWDERRLRLQLARVAGVRECLAGDVDRVCVRRGDTSEFAQSAAREIGESEVVAVDTFLVVDAWGRVSMQIVCEAGGDVFAVVDGGDPDGAGRPQPEPVEL